MTKREAQDIGPEDVGELIVVAAPRHEMDFVQDIVDAGGTVTREQAEVLVRRVGRVCKGPIKPGKEAEYAELRRQLGGPAVAGGDTAILDSLNRDYCGADFNDVVCSVPFDGREHEVTCRKCGQVSSFRAPFFRIAE